MGGGRQSWQKRFLTEDRQEAERACEQDGVQWKWLDDGGMEITSACLPALHPEHDVWFNQSHNPFSFEPLYGDGSAVEEHVMEHITAKMWDQCVAFRWSAG